MTRATLSKTPFERNLEKTICERMKEMLTYAPDTGLFVWLVDGTKNAKYKAGDVAGTIHPDGYVIISFMSQTFHAARLAWLYVYDEFPKNQIDHIDRNKENNRIDNLRDVSAWVNMQNRSVSENTISGITGVTTERFDRWSASIVVDGIYRYLGRHKSLLSAAKARHRAEKKYKCFSDGVKSKAALYIESQLIAKTNPELEATK